MTDRPATDDARARAGLAQLALGATARTASDFARRLVAARAGRAGHAGLLVADAVALTELAEAVLAAAVVAEHDAGASWDDIAEGLGVDIDAARARWTPAVQRWHDDADRAIHSAHRDGPLDDPDLPDVLVRPPSALARELDLWSIRHREPNDPATGEQPVTDAWTTTATGA